MAAVAGDIAKGIDLLDQPATLRDVQMVEARLVARIPKAERPTVRYVLILGGFVVAGFLWVYGYHDEALVAPGLFALLAHAVR